MSGGLPDAAARRQAVTDFGTNLVVSAGAGAGKTSLLVERTLNAIGLGVAPIEGIAAITFTEKAAGEMRHRLAAGLSRLRALARNEVDADGGSEADRAYAWLRDPDGGDIGADLLAERALAGLEGLDRAAVATIHRFCGDLLRRFPYEALIQPDYLVDTGEQWESSFDDFWEAFVSTELGPTGKRGELWHAVLDDYRFETLRQVARAIAGFDVPEWLLHAPAASPDVRRLLHDEITEIRRGLETIRSEAVGLSDAPQRFVDYAAEALETLEHHGVTAMRRQLDSNPQRGDRLFVKARPKLNTKASGVQPETFDDFTRRARRLLKSLRGVDDESIGRLIDLVLPAARAFRERFLSAGFVSFDGLLALTRDLLRRDRGVRARCKQELRLLLVDEFQDTDPLQYEIVLYLAERDEAFATDAFDAELQPGRLFAVGDAKQSIYRFRGADFTAYRRAVDKIGDDGAHLHLTANFRSTAEVLEPVNRLFERDGGLWKASRHQPDYRRIDPTRRGDGEPAVELWQVAVADGARADERREAEGRLLAASILDWRREGRIESFRDVTLLFRAFSNITHYLRPLREHGVPFVVDGGRDLLKRPEVAHLLAALRTLAQPADEPSLLAFLRSPLGAVDDIELAGFADARGRWDWRSAVDAARFPRIAAAYKLLRRLDVETRELPADAVIRRVVAATHLLPLGAAAFEGAQRVANLRKLAAAGADLARDGMLSLEQVVEALAEGKLADLETDRPLADDAADAVRITSIHRMKGLESRWVVLPDLAREDWDGPDGDPVRIATLPDGGRHLAIQAEGRCSGSRVWLELEDAGHGESEEIRVLYVGLTRARDRLILLDGSLQAGRSRGGRPRALRALDAWGYDPAVAAEEGSTLCDGTVLLRTPRLDRVQAEPQSPQPFDLDAGVSQFESLQALYAERTVPPLAAPSHRGDAEEPDRAYPASDTLRSAGDADAAPRASTAKATGIAIHRWLERWDGVSGPSTLQPIVDAVAREEGLDVATLQPAVDAIVDAFLASELATHFRDIEILGREVPILLATEGGTTLRGSIDLLYRDSGGAVTIADFKTDRDVDPKRLRQAYGPQLEVYRQAVHRALNLENAPAVELWALRSGRRIRWEPGRDAASPDSNG